MHGAGSGSPVVPTRVSQNRAGGGGHLSSQPPSSLSRDTRQTHTGVQGSPPPRFAPAVFASGSRWHLRPPPAAWLSGGLGFSVPLLSLISTSDALMQGPVRNTYSTHTVCVHYKRLCSNVNDNQQHTPSAYYFQTHHLHSHIWVSMGGVVLSKPGSTDGGTLAARDSGRGCALSHAADGWSPFMHTRQALAQPPAPPSCPLVNAGELETLEITGQQKGHT